MRALCMIVIPGFLFALLLEDDYYHPDHDIEAKLEASVVESNGTTLEDSAFEDSGPSDWHGVLTSLMENAQNGGGQPVILFAMGPTGSGKSGAESTTKAAYDASNTKWPMMLIDDWVENSKSYKDPILNHLTKTWGLSSASTDAQVKAKFASATSDDYKAFSDAYFNSREKGCDDAKGCKNVMQKAISGNIGDGKSFIYELTGQKFDSTVRIMKDAKMKNYKFIAATTSVKFDALMARNDGRAAESAIKFLKNPVSEPAPRAPDLKELPKKIPTIVDNVISAIKCMQDSVASAVSCTGQMAEMGNISEFYVYDNNNKQIERVAKITHSAKPGEIKVAETKMREMNP